MNERKLKFAVIGDPIKHSLSPVMHSAAYAAAGLNAEYQAIHVTAEKIAEFVSFAKNNLDGFNITVPHKNAIIPFLDEISTEASNAQSVNTVSIKNGRLSGDSTDGYGIATALREAFGVGIEGESFCFIGCGGAVQAVSFYFASKKAKSISFINRTVSKAEQLAESIREKYPHVKMDFCGTDDEKRIAEFMSSSKVAIQGTSLGLKEDDPPPVNPGLLNKNIFFYDTIYGKKTALLNYAAGHGIKASDGRAMLLHQGAKSFTIWTGIPAPVEAMRNALYSAIDRKGN